MPTLLKSPGGVSSIVAALSNQPLARNLSTSNLWTRLRVGCRLAVDSDGGADLTTVDFFFGFGLTAAGNRFKSVQTGAAQMGVRSSGTFTRAVDGLGRAYYTAPDDLAFPWKSGLNCFYGSTTAVLGASSLPSILLANGDAAAFVLELTNDGELYNGTYPIYKGTTIYPAHIASLTNCTTEALEAAIRETTMAEVMMSLGDGYASRANGTGSNSIAMGPNPASRVHFGSIEFGWNKTAVLLTVDDVRVRKME